MLLIAAEALAAGVALFAAAVLLAVAVAVLVAAVGLDFTALVPESVTVEVVAERASAPFDKTGCVSSPGVDADADAGAKGALSSATASTTPKATANKKP